MSKEEIRKINKKLYLLSLIAKATDPETGNLTVDSLENLLQSFIKK